MPILLSKMRLEDRVRNKLNSFVLRTFKRKLIRNYIILNIGHVFKEYKL